MAAGVFNLQSQVESVLGELVKVATAELTKLFESKYRASVEAADRADALLTPTSGLSRRSIGVQVTEDVHSVFGSLENGCKEVEEVEGLIPEILFSEIHGYSDPGWLPLRDQVGGSTSRSVQLLWNDNKQVAAGPVDLVEFDILGGGSLLDSEDQTDPFHDPLWCDQPLSSPSNQKPLIIKPDTSHGTTHDKVKFVCPLVIKTECPSPPSDAKTPLTTELNSASSSTPKGCVYTPSSSDGAVVPAKRRGKEKMVVPEESKNNGSVKVKSKSSDEKLKLPCSVLLVDIHSASEAKFKTYYGAETVQGADHRGGLSLPKDLRRHQGVHTGHRLCCFTKCANGIWRLQDIVAHSKDGYTCGVCGKTFSRRKILRRHERFHTGAKPYSCTVCPKTFALRKSLRRHLRFHTGDRPHTCSQCGKSFRLRDNLKAHLRFHTGEKPFSCALCGKTFRIMRNLNKHKESPCHVFVPSFRTIAGLKQ